MKSDDDMQLVHVDALNLQAALDVACRVFEADAPHIKQCYNDALLPPEQRSYGFRQAVDKLDYFVAMRDGKPFGVTGLYSLQGQPDEVWLGWFGILPGPEMRGHGLGAALFRKTVEMAQRQGYKTFRLWTTGNSELTSVANKMYAKSGLVPENTVFSYVEEGKRFPVLIYSCAFGAEPLAPYSGSYKKAFAGCAENIDPVPVDKRIGRPRLSDRSQKAIPRVN